MGECILSDEQMSYIAGVFSIPADIVKRIHTEYVADAYDIFSDQFLAHAIRSMEVYIASKRNVASYHIVCRKSSGKNSLSFPRDNRFFVFYSSDFEPKEARMAIAHELGHLFFWSEKNYDAGDRKNMESIASVFGLLLLFARNKYYTNKEDPFKGKAWQNIVNDFVAVCHPVQG